MTVDGPAWTCDYRPGPAVKCGNRAAYWFFSAHNGRMTSRCSPHTFIGEAPDQPLVFRTMDEALVAFVLTC